MIRSLDHTFKTKNPSYMNVTVRQEWLDYCCFLEWYDNQYKEKDWQLDKDILMKGNLEYSSEKCCMVPRKINAFLIGRKRDRGADPIGVHFREKYGNYQSGGGGVYLGVYNTSEEAFCVYKTWKENKIKQLADEFKEVLTKNVYNALYDYRVEITD